MTEAYARHETLPFHISMDTGALDFDRMFAWLSREAYWSRGVPQATVEKAFKNSLAFGVFHDTEGQVGCARVITDRASFAYLGDVFIAGGYRGQGLGRWLMQVIMAHADLQGLRRFMLATKDMHDLYAEFGFTSLAKPDWMMEIVNPEVYIR